MMKDEILARLAERGVGAEDIERMIRDKREQIGPHITEEGILSLIAAEHGIATQEKTGPALTIDAIVEGLADLNIAARVLRVFDEKEFRRDDGSVGRLQSLLLADQSGKIYLTLWDRDVEAYRGKVHNGNVVRLVGASSTKGPSGPQLRLGFKGRLIVEDEGDHPDLAMARQRPSTRKRLADLKRGDRYVEARGTVSNIYRLNVYDACPTCQRRVTRTKDTFFCENCRARVVPRKAMVMEIGIDDGSAHMHATLFGDSASEFLSEDADAVSRSFQEYLDAGYQPRGVGLEYVVEHKPALLGKEIVVSGAVTEDQFSGTVFNVYDINPLDIAKETEAILSRIGGEEDG